MRPVLAVAVVMGFVLRARAENAASELVLDVYSGAKSRRMLQPQHPSSLRTNQILCSSGLHGTFHLLPMRSRIVSSRWIVPPDHHDDWGVWRKESALHFQTIDLRH